MVRAGVSAGVRPGPQVYVQTRGTARATDYAFLCGAPPHAWWRAYRDATAFDHPTVLVVSDGAGWAAYLSGIPSARVDAVGTVVRYTLVLDGHCAAAPVADRVPVAVAAWLDDLAGARTGRLSAALDARFPDDDVQRWIETGEPAPLSPASDLTLVSEPGRRVLDALASLPGRPAGHDADVPGDWIGAVGAPEPRSAFVARVAALVAGTPGRALLLNLVGGPDDLGAIRAPAGPAATLAVLVESADRALARPAALPPVVEAKKAPAPRDGAARTGAAAARRTGTAAVTAVVALPVLAMLTVAVLVAVVLVLAL